MGDDGVALDAPAGPLPLEDDPPEGVKSPEAPELAGPDGAAGEPAEPAGPAPVADAAVDAAPGPLVPGYPPTIWGMEVRLEKRTRNGAEERGIRMRCSVHGAACGKYRSLRL
eukprot:5519308-Pyramimonas_sp.AAC.1